MVRSVVLWVLLSNGFLRDINIIVGDGVKERQVELIYEDFWLDNGHWFTPLYNWTN